MRRALTLTPLLLLAVAGCASTYPPPGGVQAAKFGVLITWDTTKSDNTVTAEDALIAKCKLPASTHYGAGGQVGSGQTSTYVSVPSGNLPDTQTSCLTASEIVTRVDILNGPAPSS